MARSLFNEEDKSRGVVIYRRATDVGGAQCGWPSDRAAMLGCEHDIGEYHMWLPQPAPIASLFSPLPR